MCKRMICFTVLLVIGLNVVTANAQPIKINFQSRTQGSREVPVGYLPDYGDIYGDRGNGFSYGWSVDKQASSRDRDIHPDQRYDTHNALNMWNTGMGSWEIAIPNGTYDLFIVGGDPGYTDQTNSYIVEGIEVLDETPYPPGSNFDEYNVTVTVNDGRLTIDPVGGVGYIKICFVHIVDIRVALPVSPFDNSIWPSTSVTLEWLAGVGAVQHDIYFGEDFDAVSEATTSTADIYKGRQSELVYPATGTLDVEPGKTYYWRIDEFDGTNIIKGGVSQFTVQLVTAYNPTPIDGGLFVDPDATLSWSSGASAKNHMIYFSDNYNTVANAAAPGMPGFAGSLGANVTTWDPPGSLDLNKTYYWRIDEQEVGGTTHKGDIWSFTTAPRTICGLRAQYYASENLTGDPVMTRIDPQINFDWGTASPEPNVVPEEGFSIRWTGSIDIPADGEWTFWTHTDDGVRLSVNGQLLIEVWGASRPLTWDSYSITLSAGTYPIVMEFYDDADEAPHAIVQLLWQGPLVPVRQVIPSGAFQPPLWAAAVNPGNGATGVTQAPTLIWTAGESAAEHDVYFGTDADDVANADTTTAGIYRGRQALDNTSYTPPEAPFEWGQTLYWKIDEINDVEIWKGSVWKFTIADFIIVDNFEDYNDYPPDEIWSTWIDGYGIATNGATAGHPDPDFLMGEHYMETSIVNSGRQSMPVFYDNSVGGLSEVTRTFDSSMRNWTREGVGTLTLFYYGDAANVADPMYVALNGNAVVVNDDANAALVTDWVQWDIPLSEFASKGVSLTNVNSMSIGLGNKAAPKVGGGSGHVFIDDVRLYR